MTDDPTATALAQVATELSGVNATMGRVNDTLGRFADEWAAVKVEIARTTAVQEAWQGAARELCRVGAVALSSRTGQGFVGVFGALVLVRVAGMDATTAARLVFAWVGVPWPLDSMP